MATFQLRSKRVVDPGGRPVHGRRFPAGQLRRSILRILRENVLCSMATVNRVNRAHINTAYFSYSDDLELFFLSDRSSHHGRNIMSNPSLAVAVFSTSQVWGTPDRGLQCFGPCRETTGRQREKAERSYGRRFAAYARWMKTLPRDDPTVHRLRSYRFYRFVPHAIKIFDERALGSGIFVEVDVIRGLTPSLVGEDRAPRVKKSGHDHGRT